jgi:hypothetical protein
MGKRTMKQYCVLFMDGSGKTLLGHSKEDIKKRYPNVRGVFTMGRMKEN